VHLATNFQNILYDHLPEEVSSQIYAYLDEHHADERKPDQSDEQFRYKTRKRALGPFKHMLWDLPASLRNEIEKAWEAQFDLLFERLNIKGTRAEVERHIKPETVPPDLPSYMGAAGSAEDVSDLAD
jgi:hypothetical protein